MPQGRPAGRRSRAKIAAAWVATAVMLGGLTDSTRPARAAVIDDVRSDADWILSAQLPDGAIANYVDRAAVWPYLSNFAAIGLVRATEVTGDRRYLDAAWRWLSWYQAHMDSRGFVTDYTVSNGKVVSTGTMDSTDAYAGTFLIAVRDAYRVSLDLAKLRGLATGITRAVQAIEATQQSDGLTWAKPDWRVKYLMDQAETYGGLVAATEVAKVLKNSTLASRASRDAVRMKSGVDRLWNSMTAAYDWAVHEDGSRLVNRWQVLYPDALQQVWAVAYQLVDTPRSGILAGTFNSAQATWAQPAATALFDGSSQTVGYWPVAGLALALVGNPAGPLGAASIRAGAIASNRAWPFTTGNAGQLIVLEAYGLAKAGSGTTTTTKAPVKAKTKTTVAGTGTGGATPQPTTGPTTPAPPTTTTTTIPVTAQVGPVSVSAGVAPPPTMVPR